MSLVCAVRSLDILYYQNGAHELASFLAICFFLVQAPSYFWSWVRPPLRPVFEDLDGLPDVVGEELPR